jgi:hypothetical protein
MNNQHYACVVTRRQFSLDTHHEHMDAHHYACISVFADGISIGGHLRASSAFDFFLSIFQGGVWMA